MMRTGCSIVKKPRPLMACFAVVVVISTLTVVIIIASRAEQQYKDKRNNAPTTTGPNKTTHQENNDHVDTTMKPAEEYDIPTTTDEYKSFEEQYEDLEALEDHVNRKYEQEGMVGETSYDHIKRVSFSDEINFLRVLYLTRMEDLANLQAKRRKNATATLPPDVVNLIKNLSGTYTAAGVNTEYNEQLRSPFIFHLLPHLLNDPDSLKPAYHMRSNRTFCNVVLGVPTVKRDKESYLMITLQNLVAGMSHQDASRVLIVVMIGETDMEYVINTARQIEKMFEGHIEQGLIEVISPSPAYYPDFDTLPITLGDSRQRVNWRTKQNLDTIYLMAYAQTKGVYYLMLEDDVVAKKYFMEKIDKFTEAVNIVNPRWLYIEYCRIGGIGKLFRSADLVHFITYVQLFYNNMPIDWLLESYLADKVCNFEQSTQACAKQKLKLRPKYGLSLFQHIGLYSSLKGKIQKLKDSKYGVLHTYFPHINPRLRFCNTTIKEVSEHTLERAYYGQEFFWGMAPKKGDTVVFRFKYPTDLERFTFRSGNVAHALDKFYDTAVDVLRLSLSIEENYTEIGSFDEFGLATGKLRIGPIVAIRLRVKKNSRYWAILSEIDLKRREN